VPGEFLILQCFGDFASSFAHREMRDWVTVPDARLIEPNRRPVIGITAIDYFSKTRVRSSEAVNV
jgi:hypothetical protein